MHYSPPCTTSFTIPHHVLYSSCTIPIMNQTPYTIPPSWTIPIMHHSPSCIVQIRHHFPSWTIPIMHYTSSCTIPYNAPYLCSIMYHTPSCPIPLMSNLTSNPFLQLQVFSVWLRVAVATKTTRKSLDQPAAQRKTMQQENFLGFSSLLLTAQTSCSPWSSFTTTIHLLAKLPGVVKCFFQTVSWHFHKLQRNVPTGNLLEHSRGYNERSSYRLIFRCFKSQNL